MYNLKEIIENEISVILCGYFNLNIRKKNNYEFINFMSENLNMKLITNYNETTTNYNSCIDLFFAKNVNLELMNYISYFSYHKPIFGVLKHKNK